MVLGHQLGLKCNTISISIYSLYWQHCKLINHRHAWTIHTKTSCFRKLLFQMMFKGAKKWSSYHSSQQLLPFNLLRILVAIYSNNLKTTTPPYQPFDMFLTCHFCTKNILPPFPSIWEQQEAESPRDSINTSTKDEEIANKRISIYHWLPPTSPAWNCVQVGIHLPVLYSGPADNNTYIDMHPYR